jgi:hypothetical protein
VVCARGAGDAGVAAQVAAGVRGGGGEARGAAASGEGVLAHGVDAGVVCAAGERAEQRGGGDGGEERGVVCLCGRRWGARGRVGVGGAEVVGSGEGGHHRRRCPSQRRSFIVLWRVIRPPTASRKHLPAASELA